MEAKWSKRFMEMAQLVSNWSKDPSRGVGAIVVDEPHKDIIAIGYNGIPRGVLDSPDRLMKPQKYQWVSHAESNAIDNAARTGRALLGTSMWVTLLPCNECAKRIINSGIKKVYAMPDDKADSIWWESFAISRQMFSEAGVELILLNLQ